MNDTPDTDCPPGHRLVKLRKCCRCRTVYPENEAVKRPHKKFTGATEDVCPKCGASSYYLHHAGEKKAPRPEVYRASPWPCNPAQGRPLAEIVEELESDLSRFITFMRLCFDNRELKTQFDRLRGTNVSRRGSPMNVMIDDATGKFEADARAFFDFCLDLYQRLPPPAGQ